MGAVHVRALPLNARTDGVGGGASGVNYTTRGGPSSEPCLCAQRRQAMPIPSLNGPAKNHETNWVRIYETQRAQDELA